MKRYIMTTGLMCICVFCSLAQKQMMYGDTSRIGIPFSKDPHVVEFQGKYLMYYSIPPKQNGNAEAQGWGIGIAGSKNLKDWHRIGEIIPQTAYESKGLCAPGALVRNDTVHLFYQTYGNGAKDAICHAWSEDGIHFVRNATNPIFSPEGECTCTYGFFETGMEESGESSGACSRISLGREVCRRSICCADGR